MENNEDDALDLLLSLQSDDPIVHSLPLPHVDGRSGMCSHDAHTLVLSLLMLIMRELWFLLDDRIPLLGLSLPDPAGGVLRFKFLSGHNLDTFPAFRQRMPAIWYVGILTLKLNVDWTVA